MSVHGDVDELIAAAAREQTTEALTAVVRGLDMCELFYRGTVTETEDRQRTWAPLLRLEDGSHALVVYTSKSHPALSEPHPDLPKSFVGTPWRHVLKMAANMPNADWLIVTNSKGKWIAVPKHQMTMVLDGLERSRPSGPDDSGTSGLTDTKSLEHIITEAVGATADDWSEPLMNSLRGRELFVRLSPEPSNDARPVMITSKVGDIGGLVAAYTSRSRLGITYGGMTWEAIVNMIKNAPEMPGVQIINDNDDWVVLGRSEI